MVSGKVFLELKHSLFQAKIELFPENINKKKVYLNGPREGFFGTATLPPVSSNIWIILEKKKGGLN